jgi:hypothetical protein
MGHPCNRGLRTQNSELDTCIALLHALLKRCGSILIQYAPTKHKSPITSAQRPHSSLSVTYNALGFPRRWSADAPAAKSPRSVKCGGLKEAYCGWKLEVTNTYIHSYVQLLYVIEKYIRFGDWRFRAGTINYYIITCNTELN